MLVCSEIDTKKTNKLCGQNVGRGRSKKRFMSGVVEGERKGSPASSSRPADERSSEIIDFYLNFPSLEPEF